MNLHKNITLEEYIEIIEDLNSYCWKEDQKEKQKQNREIFTNFYNQNKEFIDDLENQRINSYGKYDLKIPLDCWNIFNLFSSCEDKTQLPLMKKKDGDYSVSEYGSGLALSSCIGENMEGFDDFILKNHLFSHIEEFGGEGQGDEYWFVIKIRDLETEKDRWFKFYGWYQSYHGGEIEDIEEVVPKEVVVTKWEKTKNV